MGRVADKEVASIEAVKEESLFLSQANQEFKTPSKRSRGEFLDFSDEEDQVAIGKIDLRFHKRTFPPIESSEWEELMGSKGIKKSMVTLALSQIETSLISLGEAVQGVVTQSQARFIDNEQGLNVIAGAVHTLSSNVGNPLEINGRFEAPTLWGTAAFISDEMDRIGKAVVTIESDLTPMKEDVIQMVSASNLSREKLEESCKKTVKALVLVMNRVKEINPELALIRKKLDQVEVDQKCRESKRPKYSEETVGNHDRDDAQGEEDSAVDDLMRLLGNNKLGSGNTHSRKPGEATTPENRSTSGLNNGQVRLTEVHPPGPEINGAFAELLTKTVSAVEKLTEDVGVLKSCVEDKSVKFGGLGLRTIHDCNEWVQANFACYRYGLIMDPLLMLDRIFGSRDGVTKINQFKTWEARLKLKISTGAEEAAIAALQFNRPQIFHIGMTEMVTARNKSKLNKLPNISAWKSAGEGVRHYIVKRMNLMHTTMLNEIGYAFGTDPNMAKANSLAVSSLNDTITFLTQLLSFIDMLYEKLNTESKFSPEQAWGLTTQILDRICEELYEPKEGVVEAMTVEEPASVCCHVLWACFRTHDVMSGYLEKDFQNHPTISAEYVKFLATNSGHDKVDKLQMQMSEVIDKLAKAVDESKKATAKADAASAKCSELGREVVALTKKVKTLEERGNR